jgi:hypothetical protein
MSAVGSYLNQKCTEYVDNLTTSAKQYLKPSNYDAFDTISYSGYLTDVKMEDVVNPRTYKFNTSKEINSLTSDLLSK